MRKNILLVLTIVSTLVLGTLIAVRPLGEVQAKPCTQGGVINQPSLHDVPCTPEEAPQVSFHAFNTANYEPGGAFLIIEFDGERYDDGNNFDTDLHRFVAPTSGLYHFDAYLLIDHRTEESGRATQVNLFVNGAFDVILDYQADTPFGLKMYGGSTSIKLTAGDYVEVITAGPVERRIRGSNLADFLGEMTYFSGHQVY